MPVAAKPVQSLPETPVAPLLAWYQQQHRILPWRASPQSRNDPYRVWLSEIMLQQTTVRAVIPYFQNFTQRWPDVHALAAAPLDDVLHAWAGLGYYARARNLHKCAQVVSQQLSGLFPDTYNGLLALPGIGAYTAGAIMTIAYQKPAPVMDGNIERVISRLHMIEDALPAAKPIYRDHVTRLFTDPAPEFPGDLAQALMDLGATICTPTKPICGLCPLNTQCRANQGGRAEHYPVKAPKPPVPERQGLVYWITNAHGQILTEKRPDTGMLGGMRGLPTTEWGVGQSDLQPPSIAKGLDGVTTGQIVRHVFTHFALSLEIITASTHSSELPDRMMWLTPDMDWQNSLPTLFRKVARLMLKYQKN